MSPSRTLLVALTSALVALAHTGCVVVMPPLEHGDHCSFLGSGECAKCLRTSCQRPIDACCNDPSCAGDDGHSEVLDGLDDCGSGDVASCASRLASAESGAASSLRVCVTTSCKAACLGDAPVPVKWSCSAPPAADTACARCINGDGPRTPDDADAGSASSASTSATSPASCSGVLAECCGDTSCSKSASLADDLGRCTSGDAPGCAFLATRSMSGYEGKVRACVIKTCASECMGDGRVHASCSLEGGGGYCSCSDAEKASGPRCTGTTVNGGDGTCVLGEKGCTCGHYACERTSSGSSDGCSCDFRSDKGSSTRCDVARKTSSGGRVEGVCCIKREDRGFRCECVDYLSSCLGTGEYETPTCDLEDVMPRLKNVLVSSCSN